jgi:hypothetical protein
MQRLMLRKRLSTFLTPWYNRFILLNIFRLKRFKFQAKIINKYGHKRGQRPYFWGQSPGTAP